MYINNEGKIYLINTNMDVIFTGAKTMNVECFNTLLDGELILHDKTGKFINLYACFDIYYAKKIDVRNYTFILIDDELEPLKSRYYLLKYIVSNLNPVSILDDGKPKGQLSAKELLKNYSSLKNSIIDREPLR
jgi:hypothetical protein